MQVLQDDGILVVAWKRGDWKTLRLELSEGNDAPSFVSPVPIEEYNKAVRPVSG
jgi:hypothetical protein